MARRKSRGEGAFERTPYNIRADYRDVEQAFRDRLNAMVPPDMVKHVRELLITRLEDNDENEDEAMQA